MLLWARANSRRRPFPRLAVHFQDSLFRARSLQFERVSALAESNGLRIKVLVTGT